MTIRRTSLLLVLVTSALFLTACAGLLGDPEVEASQLLLVPNYGLGTVDVLTEADRVAGGNASIELAADELDGTCGLAYGPDDRLYVADYSNDWLLVFAGSDVTTDGTVAPLAVIESAEMAGPCGASFDSGGNLWVGNYTTDTIVRFDAGDLAGLAGTQTLTASVVLTVDDSTYASAFSSNYGLLVDDEDSLWVAGYGNEAVYRFDDVTTLAGTVAEIPDLYLTFSASAISESGQTLYYPVAVAVDADGTLYIGNEDYEVSRFDGASMLMGFVDAEADAYLDFGDYPYLVALDAAGNLWVGDYYGGLYRLPDPGSFSGYVDVATEIDLSLSWKRTYEVDAETFGYPDGGTMEFIADPSGS